MLVKCEEISRKRGKFSTAKNLSHSSHHENISAKMLKLFSSFIKQEEHSKTRAYAYSFVKLSYSSALSKINILCIRNITSSPRYILLHGIILKQIRIWRTTILSIKSSTRAQNIFGYLSLVVNFPSEMYRMKAAVCVKSEFWISCNAKWKFKDLWWKFKYWSCVNHIKWWKFWVSNYKKKE